MTSRLYQVATRLLCIALLLCGMLGIPRAYAAEIEIHEARIEATDEGYKLVSDFNFELRRVLEDALNRGVPLYFTTDVELTRPRWYWFDDHTLSLSHTIRISYNVLTRQYYVATGGNLRQSFTRLEEAMALVKRPSRWLVAEKHLLRRGALYNVAVRMRLDVTQLPKPFQVNAMNDSDWRLSSDWKTFTFKAE